MGGLCGLVFPCLYHSIMAGKRLLLCFILIGIALAACQPVQVWSPATPSPDLQATPTATPRPLPDLTLYRVEITTQEEDLCANPTAELGVRLWVRNAGAGDANPFTVSVNQQEQVVEVALLHGNQATLWFPGYSSINEIHIDLYSQVTESDETNNLHYRQLLAPTLSPDCLPPAQPEWEVQEPLHALEGHMGKVWSVAFSPDGGLLASVGVDNTLRLWRVNQGYLLRTMQGHPYPVRSLAFNHAGTHLATGSYDGLVRIWRISDGMLQRTLEGHAGWVLALAYSPNDRLLASTAEDFTVRLWRMQDGGMINIVDEGLERIESLDFLPDGSGLVWGEASGELRIWSVSDGRWRQRLNGSSVAVRSLALAASGDRLAVGYDDYSVHVWDLLAGAELQVLTGHTGAVTGVAFSPDGTRLVSGSEDGSLRLWRYDSQLARFLPSRLFSGSTAGLTSVAYSPDGDRVAGSCSDGGVYIWEVQP